jgi:Zn-dependent protease
VRSFNTVAGGRDKSWNGVQGKVVYRGPLLANIGLTVRVEAVAFFIVLAVLIDVLIMPWALDTHPMVHVLGVRGLTRVTRHASTLITHAGTAALILATVVATLVHELGHAWALRRAHASEIEIVVFGAGGVCRAQARDTSPLALIWYAAAGPLATIAIVAGLICIRIALPLPHTIRALLWLAAAVQAGTLTLNLIPLFKRSDGGHILATMSGLPGGTQVARTLVACYLCSVVGVLLATLQGSSSGAILCCAATVVACALFAAAAWQCDTRANRDKPLDRPAGTPRVIAFW